MVLTAPPDPESWLALQRITGLTEERLHALYWSFRHEYDEGKLTGFTFWNRLAQEAELNLTTADIHELNQWDARMWTVANPSMLAWQQQVRRHGLRTAILSNMGDNVHARMVEIFDWLADFDVLTWSYVVGTAKPDEAIYRHVLNELNLDPHETLFLDDKAPNIDMARSLGMFCHQFTTVDRLRADLIAQGLNAELPLPE